MNKHADFVHLHVHSEYSLLDGASRISDLVEAARKHRMPALAITVAAISCSFFVWNLRL